MTRARRAPARRIRRGDALGAWAGSWRVAIRTAWRDARRHRGISAMIMIMVGLPVAIICAGGAVLSTSQVTLPEQLELELGSTEAIVKIASDAPLRQLQQGLYSDGATPPTQRVTEAEVAQAVGGKAYEVTTAQAHLDAAAIGEPGTPAIQVSVLGLSDPGLQETERVQLRSGSWPTEPTQVLISRGLARRGIAVGATLALTPPGAEAPSSYTVVGIADARTPSGHLYDVVSTDHRLAPSTIGQQDQAQRFLITADHPIDWSMIERLNERGWLVTSRLVVNDPVAAGVPRDAYDMVSDGGVDTTVVYGAGIVAALLLETMLLAGPAFAISAIRRRRSLALLATSGATAKQLRRVTLAQGLVLGALAAPVGAGIGVGGFAAFRAIADRIAPGFLGAPFQVSPLLVIGTVLAAAVSAVAAALIPARGTKRLDIVAALTDRATTRVGAAHRMLGFVALVVTIALAVAAGVGMIDDRSRYHLELTIGIAVGAILTGVLAVGLLADVLGVLPRPSVASRLALRDLARHRPRTVPILAAVFATSAALGILNVALATTDTQSEASYNPRAQLGQLVSEGDPAAFVAEVRRQHPDWLIDEVFDVTSGNVFVEALPCVGDASQGPVTCRNLTGAAIRPVTSWPYGTPTATALAALEAGKVLVPDPAVIQDGRVTITAYDAQGEAQIFRAPAEAVDPSLLGGSSSSTVSGWMLPETARDLGLDIVVVQAIARAPHGQITPAQAAAIIERLETGGAQLEQGYRSGFTAVLRAVLLSVGAALVLLAVTVGTGLGRAEGEADRATLRAVGGTPALTRRMAAWSTGALCVLGILAGLVVGVPGGVAIARQLIYPWLRDSFSPTIPFGSLALMTVAAVVIAVVVAVATTRTRTTLTRRLG